MALQIPVDFVAEYRGKAPSYDFDGESGPVTVADRLKFEYEDDNGDVVLIPVSGSQFDKCTPPFDHKTLKRGDQVRLVGHVTLAERGEVGRDGKPKGSYLAIRSVEPAKSPGAVKLAV